MATNKNTRILQLMPPTRPLWCVYWQEQEGAVSVFTRRIEALALVDEWIGSDPVPDHERTDIDRYVYPVTLEDWSYFNVITGSEYQYLGISDTQLDENDSAKLEWLETARHAFAAWQGRREQANG